MNLAIAPKTAITPKPDQFTVWYGITMLLLVLLAVRGLPYTQL